jgi:hypothetical protein
MVSVLVALILAGATVIVAYLYLYRDRQLPWEEERRRSRGGSQYRKGYHEGYLKGFTDCRIEEVDERFRPDIEEELGFDEDDEDDGYYEDEDDGYHYPRSRFERMYETGWEEDMKSEERDRQRKLLKSVLGNPMYQDLGLD